VLRRLIKQVGPLALKLDRDPFRMLVRSILSQQISTSAARYIRLRLEERLGRGGITCKNLNSLETGALRECGLSGQKQAYITDLVCRVDNGQINMREIARLPDDEVIQQLTQVKGIGVWTVKMLLIFCLGRGDVLPFEDYGVRAAMRNLYDLPDLATKGEALEIGEPWHPYCSVASWYCWRSLDLR
jgi:DNA-3-methyladenine glycosylase II